jgi:hypothetical protein
VKRLELGGPGLCYMKGPPDPVEIASCQYTETPPQELARKVSKIVLRSAQIHQRFIATRYAGFVRLERRGGRGRLLVFGSNRQERQETGEDFCEVRLQVYKL